MAVNDGAGTHATASVRPTTARFLETHSIWHGQSKLKSALRRMDWEYIQNASSYPAVCRSRSCLSETHAPLHRSLSSMIVACMLGKLPRTLARPSCVVPPKGPGMVRSKPEKSITDRGRRSSRSKRTRAETASFRIKMRGIVGRISHCFLSFLSLLIHFYCVPTVLLGPSCAVPASSPWLLCSSS